MIQEAHSAHGSSPQDPPFTVDFHTSSLQPVRRCSGPETPEVGLGARAASALTCLWAYSLGLPEPRSWSWRSGVGGRANT